MPIGALGVILAVATLEGNIGRENFDYLGYLVLIGGGVGVVGLILCVFSNKSIVVLMMLLWGSCSYVLLLFADDVNDVEDLSWILLGCVPLVVSVLWMGLIVKALIGNNRAQY